MRGERTYSNTNLHHAVACLLYRVVGAWMAMLLLLGKTENQTTICVGQSLPTCNIPVLRKQLIYPLIDNAASKKAVMRLLNSSGFSCGKLIWRNVGSYQSVLGSPAASYS